MIRGEGPSALVRPTLCGLLILLSALPFAVVAPRLKAEYDHMRRDEVSLAPVVVTVASVEGYYLAQNPQVTDGARRKELSR
jgi:hypothetical protein